MLSNQYPLISHFDNIHIGESPVSITIKFRIKLHYKSQNSVISSARMNKQKMPLLCTCMCGGPLLFLLKIGLVRADINVIM